MVQNRYKTSWCSQNFTGNEPRRENNVSNRHRIVFLSQEPLIMFIIIDYTWFWLWLWFIYCLYNFLLMLILSYSLFIEQWIMGCCKFLVLWYIFILVHCFGKAAFKLLSNIGPFTKFCKNYEILHTKYCDWN
jgi:hypothetical protein